MKPEVLSRWLPILAFIQANPYATPRVLAGHFNTRPMSMLSTLSMMRRYGCLKSAKKDRPGFYLTEKAKKLLSN